jgi:hypothetical protein
MTDFVPQTLPLWLAWRGAQGHLECGRIVAWTPSDSDTGLLLPLVAIEARQSTIVGASVPPGGVNWHVGGSREEAERAAAPAPAPPVRSADSQAAATNVTDQKRADEPER